MNEMKTDAFISDEEMGDDDDDDDAAMNEDGLFDQSRNDPNGAATKYPAASTSIFTPVTLQHLVSGLNLPTRLTALSSLTPLSFPPSSTQPSPHPPSTSVLSILHLRALEALNNLFLLCVASSSTPNGSREMGEPSQFSTVIPLAAIWARLFDSVEIIMRETEVLGQKGQEMRMEVLQMSIGCSWGLAKLSPDTVVRFRFHTVPTYPTGRQVCAYPYASRDDSRPLLRYCQDARYRDTVVTWLAIHRLHRGE